MWDQNSGINGTVLKEGQMCFSPDGCTGWHFIKLHFSVKLLSISGATNILFISSRGAGSKVRTEWVPLERKKRSRWLISDSLPSLDNSLFQSWADQLPMNRGWWRDMHWPVTQIQLIHFLRLCPLSSSISDLSRNEEDPYDQVCELFHWYLHLNFSPQFQAIFWSPTLSSLCQKNELY